MLTAKISAAKINKKDERGHPCGTPLSTELEMSVYSNFTPFSKPISEIKGSQGLLFKMPFNSVKILFEVYQ